MRVLITGGAGFIGTNLTRRLLSQGCDVSIFDNFSKQVHGDNKTLEEDISQKVTLINGDIRDTDLLFKSLSGIDVLVHLAAETGTGQSMYDISNYFEVNVQATANMLDLIQNTYLKDTIKNIIVASSRSIYGEGLYNCREHGSFTPPQRHLDELKNKKFELYCPKCQSELKLIPTTESSRFDPQSYYALTKQIQEQIVLLYARTNKINAFALRYQNVYGPGQSLLNPYTGILAIFSNLSKQGKDIDIYEDGLESRDFVYIDDIVEVTVKSILYKQKFVGSLNVGTGIPVTVNTVAQKINEYFGNKSNISISNSFRLGDIRHNIASTDYLNEILSYTPKVTFEIGLNNFLDWAANQPLHNPDSYSSSANILREKGLMISPGEL